MGISNRVDGSFNFFSFMAAMNSGSCNLGVKVFRAIKEARAVMDDEQPVVYIWYKGHAIAFRWHDSGVTVMVGGVWYDRDMLYPILRATP